MQLHVYRSKALNIKARTGHHAPCSGWWRPEENSLPVRYLQQGDLLPALRGAQTVWTLLRGAPFTKPAPGTQTSDVVLLALERKQKL